MEGKMEIDLKELIYLLLRKWWLIVISVIVCGSLAYAYTAYYIEPQFEASTTLYVGKNAAEEGMTTASLNIGTTVIKDYKEIAKSRTVSARVIQELSLIDITPTELIEAVTVEQMPDTRVIKLSVKLADPALAMSVTNKLAEVFKEKIIEIMQVENVQIIDPAEIPYMPISPSNVKNTVIGVLFGLILSIGMVIFMTFFDNSVKTPEDVRKSVELPVIGVIPVMKIDHKEAAR